MNKHLYKISVTIILLLISGATFAKNHCGNINIEGEKADSSLESLYESWENIYSYYNKYSKFGCYSTGYFGESIADSIVNHLTNPSGQINVLQ